MIFGPPPPQPTGYLDLIKEENRHQEAMQCAAYRQMIAELQVRIAELERENDKLLHYRDWECVHCSSPAPLPEDHWQTCPNHPARKRVAALEAEVERFRKDLEDAASDYPIDIPEPRTPLAVLLSANVLLKAEVARLREALEEQAPAEPTLREFLVEFRKWLVGGIPSDLRDWLDARLGEEE